MDQSIYPTQLIRRGRRRGSVDTRILQAVPLLHQMPEEELTRLTAGGTWALYRRGEDILGPGESEELVHLLLYGTVRLYLYSIQGYRYTGHMLSGGDIIDLGTFPPPLADIVHVEVVSDDALVVRVEREPLLSLLLARPTTAQVMLRQGHARFIAMAEQLAELLCYDATTRLAHLLGRLALLDANRRVRHTRDRLGEESAMSRVQVTRSLRELQRRGLIHYAPNAREIEVPNPAHLLHIDIASEGALRI